MLGLQNFKNLASWNGLKQQHIVYLDIQFQIPYHEPAKQVSHARIALMTTTSQLPLQSIISHLISNRKFLHGSQNLTPYIYDSLAWLLADTKS